jgi:Flp pilus assembly protein TadD
LKLYPDDGDQGRNAYACGRPSEAIVEFRKAALKDPRDFYSWLNLGSCLVSLGRPDSAEAAYRNALTIDPASFSAHEGLARCAYVRGNLDQVFAILEPAVHRTSVSVQERVNALIGFPNYGLLYGYFHAARYRECLQTVDRALALVPTAGTQSQRRFQNWRASLLSMMGRGDEALASCTEFSTKADLDSIDRWELEAQRTFALTQLGKLGEARASMAILRRAEPFAFGAYVIRTNLMEAEIELADGRIDECAIRLRDAEKHGIPLFSDFWMRHEWLECRMLSRAGRLTSRRRIPRHACVQRGWASTTSREMRSDEDASRQRPRSTRSACGSGLMLIEESRKSKMPSVGCDD